MSDPYTIWILCPSGSEHAKPSDIAEFVDDGVYFDETPRFDPTEDDEATAGDWSRLQVTYEGGRPPIVLRLRVAPEELESVKRAARDALTNTEELSTANSLRAQIDDTAAAVSILIDRDTLTDEAWMMLDSLEAFLARRCDGLIWSPGDAFYDRDLQPIVRDTS